MTYDEKVQLAMEIFGPKTTLKEKKMAEVYEVKSVVGTYTDRNGKEKLKTVKIGTMIANKNGEGFTMFFDALPLPNPADGKAMAFVGKKQPWNGGGKGGGGPRRGGGGYNQGDDYDNGY